MKRPIILLLVLILLGGAYYFIKMYNKQHTDVRTTEAALHVDADYLFNHYDTLTNPLFDRYAEQVLEIEGVIMNIELQNPSEPQILLETNALDGYIRCGFKPEFLTELLNLNNTDSVVVKGICKGFLASEELDLLADREVIVSNCIIIE